MTSLTRSFITQSALSDREKQMAETKPKAKLLDPVEVDMKPSTYQPSKADMEEEIDMSGRSPDRIRETFMRPFLTKDSWP